MTRSKQTNPSRQASLAAILVAVALALGGVTPSQAAADADATPGFPAGIDEFYVDRSDDANASTCTSAPNNCTLCGAINRVNTDGIVNATIRFSSTVTQIDLTTPLPALVTTGVYILGGPGPVINGSALVSESMMTLDTSQAIIEGLYFINGAGKDISVPTLP